MLRATSQLCVTPPYSGTADLRLSLSLSPTLLGIPQKAQLRMYLDISDLEGIDNMAMPYTGLFIAASCN